MRSRAWPWLRHWLGPWLWTPRQYPPRPARLPAVPRQPLPRPLPSIGMVTPSLNQARFLGACIDSVLSQGYPALVYRVQDGGSTDCSQAVLAGYGSRLAWSSGPDGGQAAAVNAGFAVLPATDVMGWLNSDDLLLPGALARVAAAFAADPGLDLVYGHHLFIDAEGLEVGRGVLPPHQDQALRHGNIVPQETMFWRRRVWQRLGGLDPSFGFCMDWDFVLRAQAAGFRFRRLPHMLGAFRMHEAQKTATWRQRGEAERHLLLLRTLHRQPSQGELRASLGGYLAMQVAWHLAHQSRLRLGHHGGRRGR